MKSNLNIEAEGSELILKNSAGDHVIIPKKHRVEVLGMIKDNCHDCIDALVETLPVMADYAEDGSLISNLWNGIKVATGIVSVTKPLEKYKEKKQSITDSNTETKELDYNKKAYSKEDLTKIIANPDKVTEAEKVNLKDAAITDEKGNIIKVTPLKTIEVTGVKPYFNEKDDDKTTKSKQEFLLNNGYYSEKPINVKDKNDKVEVQKIQKELFDKGYDLSSSVKKDGSFDGVLGTDTLKVINKNNQDLHSKEVDGVVGKRTVAAEKLYTDNKLNELNDYGDAQTIDKDVEKELTTNPFKDSEDINPENIKTVKNYQDFYKVDEKHVKYKGNEVLADKDQCAKHVRLKLAIYGENVAPRDAWTMLTTLPDNYETGFRLFDEKPKLGKVDSFTIRKAIIDKANNITPEQRESIKNAAPLSVINLFNPTSKKQVQAYKEGNTSIGTHVGFVVELNGKKMIEHEINGKVLYEPLDKVADGTSMYKAVYIKENTNYKAKTVEVNEDYYGETITIKKGAETTKNLGSVKSNIAYAKAKDYANQAKTVLNLSDTNAKNLAKASLLILNQESVLDETLLNPLEKGIKGVATDIWKGLTGGERSVGYGRMKDEQNFSEEFRKKNNINDTTLVDRSQAGLNTNIKGVQTKLLKNYKMIEDAAKSEKLDISNKDIWKLAIKGYNFDIDGIVATIKKYKNTSFDEVEQIYEKQAKDNKKTYTPYNPSFNFETIKFD